MKSDTTEKPLLRKLEPNTNVPRGCHSLEPNLHVTVVFLQLMMSQFSGFTLMENTNIIAFLHYG